MHIATDWDGHRSGDDDNCWGPTLDDNSNDVHLAEPATRKGQDRKGCDQRRVLANMMKSKDNISDILKSVSLDEALEVQRKIDLYARLLLGSYSKEGESGAKNPAHPPQKGRPRTKDSRGKTFRGERCAWEGRQPSGAHLKPNGLPGKPGSQVGIPEGRVSSSRRG